ncbi:MAG: hypothetical protein WCQ50_02425 [Spirochaetota bacterium]
MTVSTRRRVYWLLFALSLGLLVSGLVFALPALGRGFLTLALEAHFEHHRWEFLGLGIGSINAAMAGGLLSALFAAAMLLAILISFRKTGSDEIFFLSFWAFTCAFEVGRIVVVRIAAEGVPIPWAAMVTRTVIAARFAGYGAFLLAGLCSGGFRSERPALALGIVSAVGMSLSSFIPMDTSAFSDTLLSRFGYADTQLPVVLALAAITAASYLIGARNTGEKSFVSIAIASLLLLVGQEILVTSWRPEALALALGLMAIGAQVAISRLHAWYLWQ